MNYIFEIKKDGDWRLDKRGSDTLFGQLAFKYAMQYSLSMVGHGYQVKIYSLKTGKLVYQSAEVK